MDEKERHERALKLSMCCSGDSNKADERISLLSDELAKCHKAKSLDELQSDSQQVVVARWGSEEAKRMKPRPSFDWNGKTMYLYRMVNIDGKEFDFWIWRNGPGDKEIKIILNGHNIIPNEPAFDWQKIDLKYFESHSHILCCDGGILTQIDKMKDLDGITLDCDFEQFKEILKNAFKAMDPWGHHMKL